MNTYKIGEFEFTAEDAKEGILIDPSLPTHFYAKAIAERSAAEVERWEGLPYIVPTPLGFRVECLDGGAWDRPTMWGSAGTVDDAIKIAKTGPVWRQ
jgi:hypothetical protein